MVVLCRGDIISVDPIIVTTHEIQATIQVSASSAPWLLTLVYASTNFLPTITMG